MGITRLINTSTASCARSSPQNSKAAQLPALHSPSFSMPLLLLLLSSSLLCIAHANPVFVDNPSLAQFQSGRNIRHLPCIVRKSGRSGVCMFAIDCIKQNGTHLGTCIDRFYFGSCCALKDEASLFAPEINDNSIDQNTISHFAHESTTLPTSALFKLSTESSSTTHSQHQQQQQHASELLKNVTQGYLSTAKPVRTAATATATTTTTTATRRPAIAHTTHKNSHFVVRTTLKPPSIAGKPTAAPTTIKPPRRRITTTTIKPALLTTAALEQRVESTTSSTKFVTFQIVETTTPPATEASNAIETSTRRPSSKPTKQRVPTATPSHGSSTNAVKTTSKTTVASTTTSSTTTTRPTPPVRTTISSTSSPSSSHRPHKPQSSRRPPVRKPPTTAASTAGEISSTASTSAAAASTAGNSKEPTAAHTKPTRRPVESSTTNAAASSTTSASSASAPARRPTPAVATTLPSNDESADTKLPQRPTQAPRPRPQPTADIIRVPATSAETATPATTAKVTRRPTTTAASTTTTRTTAAPKKTGSSAATTTTSPSTTTAKPTRRHSTTTTPSTTRKTTTSTTTTTPAVPSSSSVPTTEESKIEMPALPMSTTKKPGLITWTDVEAEPHTNASISSNWQSQPAQPTDWIPMATMTPDTAAGTGTDKVVISVATSVSMSESKPGSATADGSSSSSANEATTAAAASTGKPHKTTKPTKTTTTTAAPSVSSSSSSGSTSATSSTAAAVASTTAAPDSEELESSTSTSMEMSTDSFIGSSTMDYSSTEDYNATAEAGTTTLAPANALEGVDYREVCGRRMFPEPRIVGGANAAFGRWPWQISLRQWRTSTYLHKCGAALLNENWAITAAHCVDNVPPSDLLLRLGEYDLAEEEEPYGYQERRVQIVASHPQFDPRTFEYDLALLRFYEPVVFQPNIIPVCVPENDENFIGQTAFVTGWGRLYEDGPLPSVLQEVAVPVINNTICESMYRAAGYIEHIPHIFICAGWKKGGYDSCEGDSGGPMVLQREKDKRFQLGGVISWGIGCAEANQPGVYTRISEFRDWINQILQF